MIKEATGKLQLGASQARAAQVKAGRKLQVPATPGGIARGARVVVGARGRLG